MFLVLLCLGTKFFSFAQKWFYIATNQEAFKTHCCGS